MSQESEEPEGEESSAEDPPSNGFVREHEESSGEEESSEPQTRLERLRRIALDRLKPGGEAQRSWWSALRPFALFTATLGFLLLIAALFREVLLPFIFALVIVYLMEPIVSRLGKQPGASRGLPRWLSVVLVYVVFLGVVTTGVVLVVPQFVAEIVRFGQTLPEEIQAFRTESLPRYNQQLKDAVQDYLPALDPSFEEVPVEEKSPQVTRSDVDAVRNTVRLAWRKSASMAAAQAEAQARVMRTARGVRVRKSVSLDVETLEPTTQIVADMAPGAQRALGERMFRPTFGSWVVAPSTQPALKLVSSATGFDVYLGDEELEVKQTGEKTWRVREVRPRREESEQGLEDVLDLEKGLSEVLGELAQTSADQLASVIALAQALVVGIIEAFVALVLTLMVAAFISIDLPGVMSFFRGLIPSEHRVGYDRLLGEVDRGLGGVVRGQLLICLVNGVLTYIGLLILDVKFSVLLAVVAGVLSLIPIFGTILSTIPIVLFGLTDGLTTGLLALVWILGIHFIEANFLNPKIIGTSAHIHPVIVIFALLAGESAFGLVGALLAVPTASIVLTFFNFFVTHQRQRRGDPEVQGTHEDGEDARNVVA